MNAPIHETAEAVRVGVVLTDTSDSKDGVTVREDGCGVDFSSGKNEEVKSFSFDQVVTVSNIQRLHPDLLQGLTQAVSSGYNGALLICGASTEETNSLTDRAIIKEVLINLFSHISSHMKEELFLSVSVLQFYPDGSAVDLLSPHRQTVKHMTHPILGSFAGSFCEVCVESAEEAYAFYQICREKLKADPSSVSSRCSSLLSLAVEWKLHPEEMESEVCSSRLQLFILTGGASRTDLRGVNPLVNILDQIQCGAPASDKLLPFLLKDILTGNWKTVLVYFIVPRGLLDDGTSSALALAQKVRGVVTKVTAAPWCPKSNAQKIRDNITDLRTTMISQVGHDVQNAYRLAELTQSLQLLKNRSWEKRRQESEKIKAQMKSCQTPNGNQQTLLREISGMVRYLQDELRHQMEEHIRVSQLLQIMTSMNAIPAEGKADVDQVQQRVCRIQQLRGALRDEMVKHGDGGEKSDPFQQSQLEYSSAQERRRQLKEDHGKLIQEEVEKMQRDLAQDQTEGLQRELLILTRERQVLVLQIEALRAEAQQAERDLQDQYQKHQTELHCLREESLQVFRVYRQVNEEQRKTSEGRYRTVLLDAVQDAVYLSAQNQQLQADNKQLRKELGDLKDAVVVQGDPKADRLPPKQ